MRTIPIAVAGLALFGAAASAQTPPPRNPAGSPPGATQAPAPAPAKPAVNPLTQQDLSKLEGTVVYGSNNDKIGHVSDVLMDPGTKKIEQLVVASGGVLGIGGRHVALPLDQFTWDGAKGGFKIAKTLARLKAMPEWNAEKGGTMTGSSEPTGKAAPSAAGDNGSRSK